MKEKLMTATFFHILIFSFFISAAVIVLTGRIPSFSFWKFGFWFLTSAGPTVVPFPSRSAASVQKDIEVSKFAKKNTWEYLRGKPKRFRKGAGGR